MLEVRGRVVPHAQPALVGVHQITQRAFGGQRSSAGRSARGRGDQPGQVAEARRAALSAGVDAFVSKAEPPEQLLAALHSEILEEKSERRFNL